MLSGAAMVAVLLPGMAMGQVTTTARARPDSSESDRIAAEFLAGAVPVEEGLFLEVPVLGDNPAAVPLHARVTEPMLAGHYCEEMIVLAERNPVPLACRMRFSALAGTAEVAIRLRLIESQKIRVLARMSDGRCLSAGAEITVAAGGCGM